MNKYVEVSNLFMEENDIEGLELLYEITNDEIVKILLDWKQNIIELDSCHTTEFSMYEDVISYVFNKYDL